MDKFLKELITEAENCCEFRGHELDDWIVGNNKAWNKCIHCHMAVTCNSKPLPNQTNIVGEAVAISCGDKRI